MEPGVDRLGALVVHDRREHAVLAGGVEVARSCGRSAGGRRARGRAAARPPATWSPRRSPGRSARRARPPSGRRARSKSMRSAPGVGVNRAKIPPARPPARARGRSRCPPSRPVAKSAASSRVIASLWPSKTGITRRASAGVAVERVERVGVLLVDDVALDLQRRRQLAGLLREVVVEDEEALDLLDRAYFALARSSSAWMSSRTCRVAGERGDARVLDPLLPRPRRRSPPRRA